ncbi:hypothetical protein [Nostocoides sp. Soil756]|jgi:hypothetical protein|uniref:hypothetical protein n=1 Tax=Nostocoides sp. Soil756 TaxID=1736399 RepID=UPI0012FBD4CC|nr:hypothetical protein [Tetrasphaera sp. Soil756]
MRFLATLVGIFALLIGASSSASAKGAPDEGARILMGVMKSADPQAAMQKIPQAKRDLVEAALRRDLTLEPVPASQQRVSATTSGCWYDYEYSQPTLYGMKVGSLWQELDWCGNGSSVTSYSTGSYGCTGQYGFSCTTKAVNWANVGWEVRQLGRFTYKISWATSTYCGQIRGGASGLHSTRWNNCNLYSS